MQKPLLWLNAVRRHWGGIVTGGALIGVLGIWQGLGHGVPPFVYGAVALAGLAFASYRVWAEEHDALIEARNQLSETDLKKAQIEAIREQTAAQKAHTAELIRQFDEQARENNPITKAFRAVQEKQARTQLGLEPESEEYHRRTWMEVLRREYINSHDNVSPAIAAGTEPPPTEWLNKRILELNEAFKEHGKSFRLPLIKEN
jgi:hypothetical protein